MANVKLLSAVCLGSFLGYAAHGLVGPPLAAQQNPPSIERIVPPIILPSMEMPVTYSGTEVGVRVTGHGTAGAKGHLVVRINDQWQRVELIP